MNFKKSNDGLLWLLSTGRKFLSSLFVLTAGNGINSILSIWFIMIVRNIIDSATAKSIDKIKFYVIMLFCLIVFQAFMRLFLKGFEEMTRAKINIYYQNRLLKSIIEKDYGKITKYHTGELQNRLFADISIVSNGITTLIPSFTAVIVRLISAFIVMIVIDIRFTAVFAVGGIVIFAVSRFFRKKLKELHKNMQEKQGKVRSFMQEVLENILVVKVFVTGDKILEKNGCLQRDYYDTRMKRRRISIIASTGFGFVFGMGYMYALIWGAFGLFTGTITYGDLTAVIQLVGQVQTPFASLSGFMPSYYSIIASAERIMEIENIETEVQNHKYDIRKLYDDTEEFVFENLSFKYDRDYVLENLNYTIKKGSITAITGVSGRGKSTLMKLMLGVYKDFLGEIYIKTKNGKVPIDSDTRKLFSYVPQGNFIFSGTIRENIVFLNGEKSDEDIKEALRISCCDEFIDRLPNGIDTVIGEKGKGLSEGQIQRLTVARALLNNTPVLLLDECTSALDEYTERRMLENIRNLKNITCIIISHKKSTIQICDNNLFIK